MSPPLPPTQPTTTTDTATNPNHPQPPSSPPISPTHHQSPPPSPTTPATTTHHSPPSFPTVMTMMVGVEGDVGCGLGWYWRYDWLRGESGGDDNRLENQSRGGDRMNEEVRMRKIELEARSMTNDGKAKVVMKLGVYGNDVKKLKNELAKLRSCSAIQAM
ncbi:hypothetical protein Tco_0353574, partial [Tanacetum coccineum]